MEMTFVPLALLGAAILLLVIFFYYVPFLLWISAKVSGVNISLIQLFLMRIRNVPPYVITRAMIEAHKAGLKTLTRDELEAHYLAGGHVEKVVHALVSASKANIDLPFQMATAIDLAGRDVFEAVQMSVNPKVIDTPPVTAVAKDGIQLIAKARVTVVLAKKRFWPVSAKASYPLSVHLKIIKAYWKIRIPSPSWFSAKVWMQGLHSKSCPSTSLIST